MMPLQIRYTSASDSFDLALDCVHAIETDTVSQGGQHRITHQVELSDGIFDLHPVIAAEIDSFAPAADLEEAVRVSIDITVSLPRGVLS